MRVGGWSFVTVGVGHLVLASVRPAAGDAVALRRQMQLVRVAIPPSRSYADLMQGFSLAMSVMLVAWGRSVVLATHHERPPERGQVALSLGVSLAMLGTSLRYFPAPPIVLMSVASTAFGVAVDAARDPA